ncbi:MAG TPA: VWA domain-containing protein [Silvibacterium sp.]|nr:VWA domain-containing protein [Silvibacterium sp.]
MKSGSIAYPFTALVALLLLSPAPNLALAQQTTPPAPNQTTPAQTTPPAQTPPDQSAPEDGGPTGDNGSIAIPKKPEAAAPAPPPPPKPKNAPGLGNFSLHVDVPVVTVDVGVLLEKNHAFVPNLKEENFRVFENGKPQEITHFQQVKAPITAVMLVEFASNSWYFIYDMENAAYSFFQQLRPDDYVAVVTYDMHTQILTDFTQDKRVVANALQTLTMPTWRETNLFDALYTTLDRISRVEGRKYIVLISSGRDTFSKINLDKVLQKIKETPNVTIFCIGTGQYARLMAENEGGMNGPRGLTYLQADNQLSTFARMTGGMAFFPRFPAEMPEDFSVINESIRNQYVLTYTPTDAKQDGTYRKLHVELVDDEGHPLKMQDEKHKPLKYDIIARDGYRAKQEVQ